MLIKLEKEVLDEILEELENNSKYYLDGVEYLIEPLVLNVPEELNCKKFRK